MLSFTGAYHGIEPKSVGYGLLSGLGFAFTVVWLPALSMKREQYMNYRKAATVSIVLSFLLGPGYVKADCSGPPTAPILKIDVSSCKVDTQYDATLRISGKAFQVLTMHFPSFSQSGEVEFYKENKILSEAVFWVAAANGTGCKDFLERDKGIWFYGDICNDMSQNIPDIQIQSLPAAWEKKAQKRLDLYD